MALKQFKLPDVGEGLTEADILGWAVAVGDEVKVNQILVEIETAKAAVELPSPFAGVVRGLLVEAGQTVDVGTPIITIETADAGPDDAPAAPAPARAANPVDDMAPSYYPPKPEPGGGAGGGEAKREPVLVGYGVSQSSTTRRARKAAGVPAAAAPAPVRSVAPAPAPAPAAPVTPTPVVPAGEPAAITVDAAKVLAKPLVRKLAKDLGVDITAIVPSRPDGVITREEVEAAAAGPATPATAGFARAGAVAADVRTPIKGVRKATAAAMVSSAFTAPHVTEFLTLDITPTMELVAKLKKMPEFDGVKVSPLLLVAKALLSAVARFPAANATWDEAAQEIVQFGSVNLGIAAATPRGLIVPNIKDAQLYSLRELAIALNDLAAVAREGKTALADLTGGTITITNVGVFGVDTGTPILNPGEAAILAFGAVRRQPWVVLDEDGEEQLAIRSITTLGLSFDHRLVDGELGSKFLRHVGRVLEEPLVSLL